MSRFQLIEPAPTNEPGEAGGQPIEMLNIIEKAWFAVINRRYAIATITVAFLLTGLLITMLQQPMYTASSRIQVSPEQDKVTNVESLEADVPGDRLEFYQTQYSLLEARSLAERVARQLRLPTDDKFFAMYGVDPDASAATNLDAETRRSIMNSDERARRLAMTTDILLANIAINPIRRSSLVDISYTSPDPIFSATVVNAWVQQFMQQTVDRRFESTTDARKFLEGRLADLGEKLQTSERELISYAADRDIVTLQSTQDITGRTITQRTLVAANLEQLSAELIQARGARIAAQSRLGGDSSENQAINATIANLRQERARIASERAQLLSQFEEGYPAVQALTSRLEQMDRSIASEQGRAASDARENYNEALAREQRLEQQVNELQQGFQSQRRDSIQYQILQREVDTNRELYDALLQRYKEIGVAGVSSNNIAVVDTAEVPRVQSSPRMALNLLLAFVVGLFASALYVLVREQMEQTVKDPRQITTVLGLGNLGAIPATDDRELAADARDQKSELFEAYAAACTNLAFVTEHGAPRSLLVTSAQPNEGKSTSSFAIAHALSRQGKRVLLLDGDIRNPSLGDFVEIQPEAGLTHYLAGDDDVTSLIHAVPGAQLDYFAAGKIPPNPTELLASSRLDKLIRELEKRYDHVVIDGPPILGLADVPLLGSAAEGVVIIVRANGAKLRTLSSSIERLRMTNVQVFGGIVTMLDRRNAAYGYGSGYGYGYGYGRGKDDEPIVVSGEA